MKLHVTIQLADHEEDIAKTADHEEIEDNAIHYIHRHFPAHGDAMEDIMECVPLSPIFHNREAIINNLAGLLENDCNQLSEDFQFHVTKLWE